MRSVRYGLSRTRSRSVSVRRPGLVPDRGGHAEPAEVMDEPGPSYGHDVVCAPDQRPVPPRPPGWRRRASDRQNKGTSGRPDQPSPRGHRRARAPLTRRTGRGSTSSTASQPAASSRPSSTSQTWSANRFTRAGSNWVPGVPASHRHCRLSAVAPAEHLYRTGQLHQSCGQPDLLTAQMVRDALAVPLLVGLADGGADTRVEADPLGETARRARRASSRTRAPVAVRAAGTSRAVSPAPWRCRATARCRTKKAMICAVFMPSVSTPSALKPMSSANHVACSAASAWQWVFINRPR